MNKLKEILKNSEQINIINSSIEFYKYQRKNLNYYIFDSSLTQAPEPMINALLGLEKINNKSRLIMINHSIPLGLFPKIKKSFKYKVKKIEEDRYIILFKKRTKILNNTNFKDNICNGR